jgi:hypothetical protein
MQWKAGRLRLPRLTPERAAAQHRQLHAQIHPVLYRHCVENGA